MCGGPPAGVWLLLRKHRGETHHHHCVSDRHHCCHHHRHYHHYVSDRLVLVNVVTKIETSKFKNTALVSIAGTVRGISAVVKEY